MISILDMQRRIKILRRKVLKLRNTSPNDPRQLNELINEESEILKEIELEVEKEKSIITERKKLSRYMVKTPHTDEHSKKFKKESEEIKKNFPKNKLLQLNLNEAKKKLKKLKRPSKRRTQLIEKLKKLNKYKSQSSKKRRVQIKTSFQILEASSYTPRPINRQAARAVGYRPKKK
jgi:hypothetical protein